MRQRVTTDTTVDAASGPGGAAIARLRSAR